MFARSIILSTCFALLSRAAAVAIEVPSIVTRDSSGIDIQAACNFEYGNGYTATRTGGSCYDWVCRGSNGQSGGVNLDVWCAAKWGIEAYAECDGGIYDWVCTY